MLSSRRRSVRAARTVLLGSPSSCVHLSRLCASAANTVQAPLAWKWPEGKCASAWSLRSAMTARRRRARGAGLDQCDVLIAVGDRAEAPPVGPQLGLGTHESGAPDDQPPAGVGGLGGLRLTSVGVVDALPGVLVNRLDGRADGLDHPHPDRVLPAGLLQALEDRKTCK